MLLPYSGVANIGDDCKSKLLPLEGEGTAFSSSPKLPTPE